MVLGEIFLYFWRVVDKKIHLLGGILISEAEGFMDHDVIFIYGGRILYKF